MIRERICNESGKLGGGQSCERKLRCLNKPRYTLPVVERGISSEGYNEGGLGMPDKGLYN